MKFIAAVGFILLAIFFLQIGLYGTLLATQEGASLTLGMLIFSGVVIFVLVASAGRLLGVRLPPLLPRNQNTSEKARRREYLWWSIGVLTALVTIKLLQYFSP